MNPLANLNGKIMPLDEVTISPLDRGFLFGDAVYEVLRIYCGQMLAGGGALRSLYARSLAEIRITGVDMPRMRHACTRRSRRADSGRRRFICK